MQARDPQGPAGAAVRDHSGHTGAAGQPAHVRARQAAAGQARQAERAVPYGRDPAAQALPHQARRRELRLLFIVKSLHTSLVKQLFYMVFLFRFLRLFVT